MEQGWFHEARTLALRATPGARVAPDAVGTDDTPAPTGNGERIVEFVLRTRGPMFPAEIAEATGLAHGTVKNVLSRLRQVPYPRVEDTGETDERGSNQVQIVERNYGDGTPPWSG